MRGAPVNSAANLAAVDGAGDEAALEQVRLAALGKKGEVSALMRGLGAMSAEERQQQRNRELRIAALLLPADLPLWTRARLLHQAAKGLARARRDSAVEPVRDRLRVAALYAALPGCQKQFARILAEDTAAWTSTS